MKITSSLVAGAIVSGGIALTGSALTASSTIDDADINVGSVTQTIDGVMITQVVHGTCQ